MPTVLEARTLTRTYGSGRSAVAALRPTDLTLEAGEFVAIVGRSGSGKSTLLHLLAGLDTPSDGAVRLEDVDLYALSEEDRTLVRRRRIGFVFQFFNLVPVLTAGENIALPALLDGRRIDRDYFNSLLAFLGLSERQGHLPGALSGGEQQRVAIARALINRPAIIFADEPTGNLDTHSAGEVLRLLQRTVSNHGCTLVMVTHDPDMAAYAGRTITLQDGRIITDERRPA